MAPQLCPNCSKGSFSWSIDEAQSPLTLWSCTCGYSAYEDEAEERNCNRCGNKTESRMKDKQKEYWWCSNCNEVNLIKITSSSE